jgi:hypothetical protein
MNLSKIAYVIVKMLPTINPHFTDDCDPVLFLLNSLLPVKPIIKDIVNRSFLRTML